MAPFFDGSWELMDYGCYDQPGSMAAAVGDFVQEGQVIGGARIETETALATGDVVRHQGP